MKILVTGATGGYGGYAVEFIKEFAPEAELYGLARDEEKASILRSKGVTPRIGDYSNPESLVAAFQGIDRLLFVSVSVFELQKPVVEAAKKAGVGFIAYTSLAGLENAKFGLEFNHRAMEQLIRESGIPHVFLRNNWYLELSQDVISAAAKTGKLPFYAGNGKVSWALRKDYAEAGARVITGDNYPEILEFAGEPVSYPELAKAIEEATRHSVKAHPASKGEFTNWLIHNGATPLGLMLGENYQDYALAGNNGEEELNPRDFELALGHPLRSLPDSIKELLS